MNDVPRPSQSPYLSGFMYVCFHIQGAQTLICLPVAGQGGAPRRFPVPLLQWATEPYRNRIYKQPGKAGTDADARGVGSG